MNRVALTVSTWFGCGYWPWGPGTAGSLAAAAIAYVLTHHFGFERLGILIITLALLWPGIWSATRTAIIVGRKDPGLVVVDEVLGQWVTLLGASTLNWRSIAAGFILFRVFDIWKPWPVRRLESLPGGTGIVMDDIAAGIYGAVVLCLLGVLKLY